MSFVVTTLRRSLWLLLIGAVGGVAWSWWSDRNAPPSPTAPPEWPPLDTQTAAASVPTSQAPTFRPPATAPPEPVERSTNTPEPSDQRASSNSGSASVINALVDTPDARSSADTGSWVLPDVDGACPVSHQIKANDNSGIFHVPGGRFYGRTKPERCYSTPDAAAADGYRQAKN